MISSQYRKMVNKLSKVRGGWEVGGGGGGAGVVIACSVAGCGRP